MQSPPPWARLSKRATLMPVSGAQSSEGSSLPTLGDAQAPGAASALRGLVCGDLVGRYRITGVLGHGGMGVVYAAHDPELDRKLAIKVMHPHARGSLGGTLGQQRMLREARAMARLTHPNVVTVHDVGPLERSVFVAMELIDGQTVTAWSSGGPRRWRDVLAVFLAAGEGLAAAHRVGLVHRDFKPDNVMIAADPERPRAIGRVVVMDFGLARAADDAEEQATSIGVPADHDARLTLTGALLGTPAYMAPEQHRASTTSALSDQFAFCVALHEALWGMRPFDGENIGALALAVAQGKRAEPPDMRGVPARILRVLARGLAADPQARWPTMRALLDALANDPARARRRWLAIGALPVLVVGGAVALDRWGTPVESLAVCSGGRERVDAVWNDARRAAVASGFAASGRGNADETRARVEARLDGFVGDFEAEYQRACTATNIARVQSPELMDRRMSCLARRVHDVDAVLHELEHVEDRLLDRAVSTVTRATDLASCRDVDAVARDVELPADTEGREWVESLQVSLGVAKAQRAAGKSKEALATLDGVLARLEERDVPAFRAAVLFHRAQVLAALGDPIAAEAVMLDAHWTARRSGNDRVAAQTAAELMVMVSESRPAEVAMWEQQARAEVERLGDRGELRARLLDDLAQAAMHRRDLDTAGRLHAEALPLWAALTGPDSLDVAVAEHGLGNVEFLRRDDAAARAHYDHAIAIWRAQLGEHHPQLTDGYIMLGNLAHRAGDLAEAERQFELALQVGEVAYGPEHVELLGALNGLGLVYGSRGEHARALEIHERGLRASVAAWGEDHPEVAIAASNCAGELGALGRHDDALAGHRRALAIRERTLAPGHPVVAESLEDVAGELVALHRGAEAEPLLARAVAIAMASDESPEAAAALRASLAALRAELASPPRSR
jgi:tRNA A-37 threonylcarbamoyl transferase component Bud32/tetratricopeptide (TPR) repeat protein